MKYMNYLAAAALLLGTPVAGAAISDAQFAEMQAQFTQLAERLTVLEAENTKLKEINEQTVRDLEINSAQVAAAGKRGSPASWTETVRIKGDFRYRYENIDEENKSARERNRIRARAAIVANLDDDVEVGLGFASGGDDPVSTNQTLGGGGSTKDLRLDLAYFNWGATENLNLIGGKYKNIYYRPQKHGLIWDGDYNPEGIALSWTPGAFFLSAGGTWLESDSKKDNSQFGYGGQAGYKGQLGGASLVAGVGYQHIETAGKTPFFGSADDFFGNSFVCTNPGQLIGCEYLYDYKTVQGFFDMSMSVADMPLSLFADYVYNTDADENETGYAVGVKLGKTSGRGTWDLAYIWQDLEADATLGLLTDSDFGGGGTDAKGHVFKGGVGINKKWSLGVTYFRNQVGGNAGDEHDYDRIMLDTKFKY
jgi:hypothetical protein